jgi:hypothetical protein
MFFLLDFLLLKMAQFRILPNLVDGMSFAQWPLDLTNVTLYSNKKNNHSKI